MPFQVSHSCAFSSLGNDTDGSAIAGQEDVLRSIRHPETKVQKEKVLKDCQIKLWGIHPPRGSISNFLKEKTAV